MSTAVAGMQPLAVAAVLQGGGLPRGSESRRGQLIAQRVSYVYTYCPMYF